MSTLRDVPLGQPRIRWWELDDTSPKYFKAVAAPSDDDLVTMWSLLAAFLLILWVIVAIVFTGLALSKTARKNPFNLYLLFLMFPDFIYSFMCWITCLMSALKGEYWSPAMCRWQSVYMVFGTAANAWLNVATTREIHRLLRRSHRVARYSPPTRRHVVIQSVAIYLYSLFLALLILVKGKWLPQDVDAQYGFVCLPMQYDRTALMFWYLVFVPLYIGIPIVYITWVFFDVYYHNLLPASARSRSRALTIFFFRITVIFIIFWTPAVVVYYVVRGIAPWGMFVIGLWSHSQGAVAALVTFMKPDVKEAVMDFVRCRWRAKNAAASCRTDESIGTTGYNSSLHQSSTDFTIRRSRLKGTLRLSGPVGDSLRILSVEHQESSESFEEPTNPDAIHETSEREHEGVEANNCLAVVEARKQLLLELEGLDDQYWHEHESSGEEQCNDVEDLCLAIPKPQPSKLKEVMTDDKV
jgi:hypothetical protein